MIATPSGWSRRHAGADLVFFPPEGPARGGIRYCERLTPLAPIRTLVEEHLRGSSFSVTHMSRVERLTTHEGEHAALVTVAGRVEGRPAQRDIGFVLLDGAYARTGAVSFRPDDFAAFTALVRTLVRGDAHFAGERRRWFEHDCPEGWQARARGFHAEWYPIDFPREFAIIHVWPALPATRVGVGLTADGWREMGRDPAVAIASDHGLSGALQSSIGEADGGRRTRRVLAVLEDTRYVYPLRLETTVLDDGAHMESFRRLIRSVRPVPHVGGTVSPFVELWAE